MFYYPGVSLKLEGRNLTISAETETKQLKAMLGTFIAHASNMGKGVSDGYTYDLKVVFSHFPMTIKQVGNVIEINNFLGEKVPRLAKVIGASDVKIEKDRIEITGINKEDVSQTAANIEQSTKVKRRDVRVFQDGVYITNKSK